MCQEFSPFGFRPELNFAANDNVIRFISATQEDVAKQMIHAKRQFRLYWLTRLLFIGRRSFRFVIALRRHLRYCNCCYSFIFFCNCYGKNDNALRSYCSRDVIAYFAFVLQRRDDDVLIALLKPVSEIGKILKADINQANAAAPVESKPVEKTKTTSSNKTKRVKAEQNGVDRGATVDIGTNETDYCNEEVDGIVDEDVMNNVIDISESTENDDDDDDSIRVDMSVEDVSCETNETKPDGICNETETDETETQEINEIDTEQIDDSNDGLIANKSENFDLASDHGEQVSEIENDQNEKRVDVHESFNDRVIGRKQSVEKV